MSLVLVMHGVVPSVDSQRFAFRNLFEVAAFEDWLRAAPPCVSLDRAIAGRGTALTIDDATKAGADAALLARRLGHQVSLFVNPAQVLSGEPYTFVVLNALMDAITDAAYVFEGQRVRTVGAGDRQTLRRVIKKKLESLPLRGRSAAGGARPRRRVGRCAARHPAALRDLEPRRSRDVARRRR